MSRTARAARRSPPLRVITAVRGYLKDECAWETAVGLAGVSRAEDARWRDAVEAAEEAGEEAPANESAWMTLWVESRTGVAKAMGALMKKAKEGKDVVAACRLMLPIEGGEAWAPRGPESGISDADGGLDEIAIERLSKEQRREMAEWAAKAVVGREAVQRLMREARGGLD